MGEEVTEKKLNPVFLLLTGVAVAGISLYINHVSYRNLIFGKMIIFLIIGGLMFLYGGLRYLLEKPTDTQHTTHHSTHTTRHQPQTQDRRPQAHCRSCGTRVPSHAKFCHLCGRPV